MSEFLKRAADGCHKYGWIINIVVMALMFAYFTGEMRVGVDDLKAQITHVESLVDQILLKR